METKATTWSDFPMEGHSGTNARVKKCTTVSITVKAPSKKVNNLCKIFLR